MEEVYISQDILYKIVLVGDSGTGKTNILSRYIKHDFKTECKSTVGVEYNSKRMMYNGKTYKLQLWDTAGQERYRAMTTSHYKGSVGAMVIFDITNWSSFENASNWIREIVQLAETCEVIMLVGNKIDLNEKRAVDTSSILR
jgi:small GTP-binding protein